MERVGKETTAASQGSEEGAASFSLDLPKIMSNSNLPDFSIRVSPVESPGNLYNGLVSPQMSSY